MSSIQLDVSVPGATPQRWSIPTFAVATAAVLLTLALTEAGAWAWTGFVAVVTARMVAPALVRQPWRVLCVVVLPAILSGETWTFVVGTGSRITPSLVVVSACVLISTFALWRHRNVRWREVPVVIPFAIYWIAVVLSVIPAVSKVHWARGVIEVTLGYGFFLFGYLYLQTRNQLHSFLKLFVGLSVATVLFGILQHSLFDYLRSVFPLLYGEVDIATMEVWYGSGRMVANWVHPSILGSIINLSAPIALYYYLVSEKFQLKYLLIYGLLAVGVLMTGTRTPIVAFGFSSVLLAVLLRRRMSRLIIPAAVFLLLALILPFLFSSLERFDMSEPENEITMQERALTRFEALLLFLHNPVLGVGARNYQDQVVFSEEGAQMAAHNVFAQQAAETGLVGITAFIVLLYAALRVDFHRPRAQSQELRDLSWALFAACLAILVECLAENSLYVWQIWCLFWLFRGMSVAVRTRPENFTDSGLLAR